MGIIRALGHFCYFNSLRSLYEGGDMGEGIIKKLRPFTPNGIREGWAKNLLLNYYRQDVLTYLIDITSDKKNIIPTNIEALVDHSSFRRYWTKFEIEQNMMNKMVISVLY